MVALPVAYLVIKIYKTSFSIKKREEKIKNPHLGPFSSRLSSLRILLLESIKHQLVLRKKKKTSPRAQTMRPASFGPIFVVAVAYIVIIIYKTSFSIKKRE